jgi:2-dehydropantoate 2-reductase
VLGARLFQRGDDVTLIARGENFSTLSKNGLRLETPDETVTLAIPVVDDPADVAFGSDDLVVLTMKSQDTLAALGRLSQVAPRSTRIVCAQNGIENERVALRMYQHVYAMCVMCPATHLTPGVVQASSSPVNGLMDVGRWPAGRDDVAHDLAGALTSAHFDSVARDDIARWKWGKLLSNLGNAVEAVCGPSPHQHPLALRAHQEGQLVLDTAGIDFVGHQEDAERRAQLLNIGEIGGAPRGGGSTWQSLVRGSGSVETDYLTGEIVLQGRLHGVATPVNELLQRLANQLSRERRPPGAWSEDEVLAMLDAT